MRPMKPTSVQRLRNGSRGQEINEAVLSLARQPVLHKNSLSSCSPSRADSCAQTRTRAHSSWLRTPTKSHLVLLCLPHPNHHGWGVERLPSWILIGWEHGGCGGSTRGEFWQLVGAMATWVNIPYETVTILIIAPIINSYFLLSSLHYIPTVRNPVPTTTAL